MACDGTTATVQGHRAHLHRRTPSAGIAAETVVLGDPSWAGPLAGAQLGLSVYHVLEEELRDAAPADVREEQVGLMSDVLDVDAIAEAVREFRDQAPA